MIKDYAKEFEKYIKNIGEYELLGEYCGALNKIEIKHMPCGKIWNVAPGHFKDSIKKGILCRKCFEIKFKKEFEKYVKNTGEYELLGEYKSSSNKVKIKHISCGYIWNVNPKAFKNLETRCPKCSKRKTVYEYYKNKPTYIYYIKINNQYKIGITNKRHFKLAENAILKGRYFSEIKKGISIEIIDYKLFEDGYEAFLLEQKIIQKFQDKLIDKKDMILESGHTETFTENVLENFNNI
jgi:plasmid maintenance system killer protein